MTAAGADKETGMTTSEIDYQEMRKMADRIAELQAQLAAADALAEAGSDIMIWIENWEPDFAYEDEWEETEEKWNSALAAYRKASPGASSSR